MLCYQVQGDRWRNAMSPSSRGSMISSVPSSEAWLLHRKIYFFWMHIQLSDHGRDLAEM